MKFYSIKKLLKYNKYFKIITQPKIPTYKQIETLEDLERAFNNIPEDQRDYWCDCFWTLYSQGKKIIAKV